MLLLLRNNPNRRDKGKNQNIAILVNCKSVLLKPDEENLIEAQQSMWSISCQSMFWGFFGEIRIL